MNDLISRQAAIDAMNTRLEDIKLTWRGKVKKGEIAMYLDMRGVIETLPSAQPEQRWIPCSERLPEFDVKVLAYVKNKDPEGRFNKDGIYTATLEDKVPVHDPEGKRNFWGIPGYDSEWTVWSWSYFTEPNVLAWMPLPEPWEGEGNERA